MQLLDLLREFVWVPVCQGEKESCDSRQSLIWMTRRMESCREVRRLANVARNWTVSAKNKENLFDTLINVQSRCIALEQRQDHADRCVEDFWGYFCWSVRVYGDF